VGPSSPLKKAASRVAGILPASAAAVSAAETHAATTVHAKGRVPCLYALCLPSEALAEEGAERHARPPCASAVRQEPGRCRRPHAFPRRPVFAKATSGKRVKAWHPERAMSTA